MEITKSLEKLGLNSQEIKTYIACLKLESAKASQIAASANLERQAVYYILNLLLKRGFITQTTKSGVMHYSVVNPKLLIGKIEDEQRIKKEAIKIIEEEYESMKGVAISRPKVEQYEGVEGFKTILREMIDVPNQELYSYSSEKVVKFQPFFLSPYVKQRKEKNIKLKTIGEKSLKLKQYSEDNKVSDRKIKFIDKIMDGKDYAMAISKDKVIFVRVTEKEQIGIKIEDPSFAELQANIFRTLWKNSNRL